MKALAIAIVFLTLAGTIRAVGPGELDDRIHSLNAKFAALQDKPDKAIPAKILNKACGIVLLDRTKAGVVFAFQGGAGVALARNPRTREWSPAAFVSAKEASLGFQIGAEQDFLVILIMNTNATRMLTDPNYSFGGEARGTAGDVTSGADANVNSPDEPVLVYDDRKGLYGGAAIKGGAINADEDANRTYYGKPLTMKDILFDHQVTATPAATDLAAKLDTYSHDSKQESSP